MPTAYATATDCADYVLQAYLDAIENLSSGSLGRHLTAVSEEIDEAVAQGGWARPEGAVSAVLRRCAAVLAAHRAVGEITTMEESEAQQGNEWLPLQRQATRAERELDQVRAGKLDPWAAARSEGDDEDGLVVQTREPAIDWMGF